MTEKAANERKPGGAAATSGVGSARDDAFYWEGLAQRELRVRVCERCGRAACPPRPGCPHCGAEAGRVVVASGRGTLYTWTVCHTAFDAEFKPEVPYVVGVVALPEGGRMVARIEGAPPGTLVAEMPLVVRWSDADVARGRLVFVPATAGATAVPSADASVETAPRRRGGPDV